jgi:hypothetical protein
MAAIISGLTAVPVRRLKRTWDLVPAQFHMQLGGCEVMIDPNRNFMNYRNVLAKTSPPCVPYIGESPLPGPFPVWPLLMFGTTTRHIPQNHGVHPEG